MRIQLWTSTETRPQANTEVSLAVPRRRPIDGISRRVRRLTDVEHPVAAARERIALVKHVVAEHRQLEVLVLRTHRQVDQTVRLLHRIRVLQEIKYHL